MTYGNAVREELRAPARELRRAIPDVYHGYAELHGAALRARVLDVRTKELIGVHRIPRGNERIRIRRAKLIEVAVDSTRELP